jgi:hypothetical protein
VLAPEANRRRFLHRRPGQTLQPADVRDHLERLRRGHAILRDLRLAELRTLSVDEARLQYDQLVRVGQTQSLDRGPETEGGSGRV